MQKRRKNCLANSLDQENTKFLGKYKVHQQYTVYVTKWLQEKMEKFRDTELYVQC